MVRKLYLKLKRDLEMIPSLNPFSSYIFNSSPRHFTNDP